MSRDSKGVSGNCLNEPGLAVNQDSYITPVTWKLLSHGPGLAAIWSLFTWPGLACYLKAYSPDLGWLLSQAYSPDRGWLLSQAYWPDPGWLLSEGLFTWPVLSAISSLFTWPGLAAIWSLLTWPGLAAMRGRIHSMLACSCFFLLIIQRSLNDRLKNVYLVQQKVM